jgi:hypothetical protein
MRAICSCKNEFVVPSKYIYPWETLYCSKECWRNSIEYKYRKQQFTDLYKTLHPAHYELLEKEILSMPFGYEDEVYYWIDEINASSTL